MNIVLMMCLYALSMSISPGPVNMVALASGANHGFKKAMPFVSGAALGFSLLLLMLGLGLGRFLADLPLFMAIGSVAGATFICYLGYKIASSTPELHTAPAASASFLRGALLQWLNPKAWVACLSGIWAFRIAGTGELLVFVGLYFVICYASIACWALAGGRASRFLTQPRNLRLFNRCMGGALVVVAIYLLVGHLIAFS